MNNASFKLSLPSEFSASLPCHLRVMNIPPPTLHLMQFKIFVILYLLFFFFPAELVKNIEMTT